MTNADRIAHIDATIEGYKLEIGRARETARMLPAYDGVVGDLLSTVNLLRIERAALTAAA